MNIILCGLPTSGKSYFGKLLSEQIQWPFLDTDKEIEHLYRETKSISYSCREISIYEGERYFRELEKEVVAMLKSKHKTVIAIGGGTLMQQENRELLKAIGKLFYLKNDPKIIWKRILERGVMHSLIDSTQPEVSFQGFVRQRIPYYEAHCDYIIESNQEGEDFVELLRVVRKMIDGK